MIELGPANGAYGLMFHRFCAAGRDAAWQGALTAEEFDRILDDEVAAGGRFLPPDEWLERLSAGRLEAADRCVTFDDGLQCQFDIALPALDARGVTAFWFVCSGPLHGRPVRGEVWAWAAGQLGGMAPFIEAVLARLPHPVRSALDGQQFSDYVAALLPVAPFYSRHDLEFRFLRNHPEHGAALAAAADSVLADAGLAVADVSRAIWMESEHWRELTDRGHHVGLHSHTHPYDMGGLPVDKQREEYALNAALIRRSTGRAPTAMSHPLNAYSAETLDVLRELGVTCGFCAHRLSGSIVPTALTLPREDPATVLVRQKPAGETPVTVREDAR